PRTGGRSGVHRGAVVLLGRILIGVLDSPGLVPGRARRGGSSRRGARVPESLDRISPSRAGATAPPVREHRNRGAGPAWLRTRGDHRRLVPRRLVAFRPEVRRRGRAV